MHGTDCSVVATMLDARERARCRVLTFPDADRDGAAEPEARRPCRQCARIARRYRRRPARRCGARGHARVVALRLSSGRPAAAPRISRCVRKRARGTRRASARHDGDRRLSRASMRGRATTRPPSFATAASPPSIASTTCPITPSSTRIATSSPAPSRACSMSTACSLRHPDLRGLLVRRSGATVARSGRGSSSSCRTDRRITRCSRRRACAQIDARVRETGVPFVYVNRVGGQDELVFDGASFVMDADGDDRAAASGVARDAAPSRTSTARRRDTCAARSTTRSSRTSTRRW